MKTELYREVVLATDIKKHNLRKGDVAKVVDFVQGNGVVPDAYILEAYNVLGVTIAVFTLPVNLVQPLVANEVFHV